MLESYSETLASDTSVFSTYAGAGKARLIEAGRIAGKHAAEMTKIAGAVALGIYISKKLERDK